MQPSFVSLVPLALAGGLAGALAAQDLAGFRAALDERLAKHPFFTKIEFTVVDRHPPFLFYLQRPPRDAKDYERRVINSYLPFLEELTRQCEQHYWQPAGLARSAAAPAFAIAILDSAGSYLNFRTAIGEPALAQARAHYTPDLRLAVTYLDSFAQHDTNAEERHALLHEFVHALQHAYGGGDQMPKPVWYNEGLADYRASCSTVARSLAEPPLQHRHVQALGFGFGNPAGRFYVAPLADLVAATSYQQVLDLAKQRNGAELRVDFLLPMFYAQAEMFVRFLHEVDDGALQPRFLAYLEAAQAGNAGLETFQAAFDCRTQEQLTALEGRWLRWLDAVLRRTYPGIRDLTAGIAGGGTGGFPLSPPSPIDKRGLAFTAADFDARIAGSRRACADGRYEVALEMLPGDSDELEPAQRERARRARARVAAVIALRDDIVTDGIDNKRVMPLPGGPDKARGRMLRLEGRQLVMEVDRAERNLPLTLLDPTVLVREGNRLKRFDGENRWLQVWLRWLQGEDMARLKRSLALDYGSMAELRADLTDNFDVDAGAGAEALSRLQALEPTDDAQAARAALEELRAVLTAAAGSPLVQGRKAAIEGLARAYAERAFDPTDLGALGITGKVTKLSDGRIEVDYSGDGAAVDFDCKLIENLEGSPIEMPENQIAYGGPTGFVASNGARGLIGSGQLQWPVPMGGPQTVEFDFVAHNPGDWALMLCTDEGGCLFVSPFGQVLVLDEATGINDVVGGVTENQIEAGKSYRLRIQHDGERSLVVSRGGKQLTNVTNVGSRKRGSIRFFVHASTPLTITNLKITGKPEPVELEPMRESFVAGVLERLWQ